MGWLNRGGKEPPKEKASGAKTPPMQPQKPVYGDKKIVKSVKPKKRGEGR